MIISVLKLLEKENAVANVLDRAENSSEFACINTIWYCHWKHLIGTVT